MLIQKVITYLITILFFVLLYVVSAPVFAENLFQVYQHTKLNDIQLKISETGFLATLEKRPQALSGLKPQVALTASASENFSYAGRSIIGEDRAALFNLGYDLTLTKSLIQLPKKFENSVEKALSIRFIILRKRNDKTNIG